MPALGVSKAAPRIDPSKVGHCTAKGPESPRKTCAKCGVTFPTEAFSVYMKRGRPTRRARCEACLAADAIDRRARRYQRDKDRYRTDPAYRAMQNATRMESFRRWRRDNPGKVRESGRRSSLKTKYGITQADYDRMLAEQGSKCALCRSSEAGGRFGRWHVDHCHRSDRVRGLLCYSCNIRLGSFESLLRDADLSSVLDYLEPAERKSAA